MKYVILIDMKEGIKLPDIIHNTFIKLGYFYLNKGSFYIPPHYKVSNPEAIKVDMSLAMEQLPTINLLSNVFDILPVKQD